MKCNITPNAKVYMFCNGYSDLASACVNWATELLVKDYYSDNLAVVAGSTTPYDIYELREYTIRALKDLGLVIPTDHEFTELITHALVVDMTEDRRSISHNLEILSGFCLDDDYSEDLYPFYSLWHAYDSLYNFDQDVQWYWEGIDRDNFYEKAYEFFKEWLKTNSAHKT